MTFKLVKIWISILTGDVFDHVFQNFVKYFCKADIRWGGTKEGGKIWRISTDNVGMGA